MADTVETTEAAEVVATTPASTDVAVVTQEPASFINADGTFKEGWESLVPEDFRGRKVYGTFTDIKGLLKQVGNQDLVLSRGGRNIVPPGEDATQTEKDAFYDALGRPKTSSDYKFNIAKEAEPLLDKTIIGSFQETAYKLGLNPAQAQALLDWNLGLSKSMQENAKAAEEAANAAGLAEMEKRWGAALPERTALVQRMLREYMAPEDKDKIEDAINKNPYIADLLSNIGKKFIEHTPPAADGVDNGALTPVEAKNRMEELIAEQAQNANMRFNNPGKWAKLNEEIRRLSAKVK
jgi:hypothetical protein